jgi:hypothetical protein
MSETVLPAQVACPSVSWSETIWQGDQISPLFHEDDQDDQAINLIILVGECTAAFCQRRIYHQAPLFLSLDSFRLLRRGKKCAH